MIRTLIVDDDALTLELHRDYVARLDGFTVAGECSSARAAVHAVLKNPGADAFDLVLLDITMPDGSGIDVLRSLRARAAATDVIAITGVRDAESVRQMRGARSAPIPRQAVPVLGVPRAHGAVSRSSGAGAVDQGPGHAGGDRRAARPCDRSDPAAQRSVRELAERRFDGTARERTAVRARSRRSPRALAGRDPALPGASDRRGGRAPHRTSRRTRSPRNGVCLETGSGRRSGAGMNAPRALLGRAARFDGQGEADHSPARPPSMCPKERPSPRYVAGS